jgi:hypothetical protein
VIELLRIATDRAVFALRERSSSTVTDPAAPGAVVVTPRRAGLAELAITVHGRRISGTRAAFGLREQRDYTVYASAEHHTVEVAHRDPNLTAQLGFEHERRATFGVVNFGSQIGRATFTLLVDGKPELDIELKVFPSKLDFETDYVRLLADVQGAVSGLALEYLRATFHLALPYRGSQPSELEWVILMRNVAGELARALRSIAARPIRGLTREPRPVHASRVRRVDAALRAAIRRGRGAGPLLPTAAGVALRTLVPEGRASSTLDTPEHRWLAQQVTECRRRVAVLLRAERAAAVTPRRKRVIAELAELERTLAAVSALEPLAAATGEPPPGFASLQLTRAPGYRDAHRQCTILRLGLRIEGGPFDTSVKDLSVLYEYWCYLALLQIVAGETGSRIPPASLIAIQRGGLRVMLRRGRATQVAFADRGSRRVLVTYNPQFAGNAMLIAQRPDILITLRDRDWPDMNLVVDAKYRIDSSAEYLREHGVTGPPRDGLNALHRYRDAIIARRPDDTRPLRSVIQAIAVFPGSAPVAEFQGAAMWRSIDEIGVGAIPALPESLDLLQIWLRGGLERGGWALADRAPRHVAVERSHTAQREAAQRVLLAALLTKDPHDHLAWIHASRVYYAPLSELPDEQFQIATIALYTPRGRGAITHTAAVVKIDVVPRRAIASPWPAADPDALQVRYQLGAITPLPRPFSLHGREVRRALLGSRVSSMLAMRRATGAHELAIRTEDEWRLVETLRRRGAALRVRPRPRDAENPDGRTWLEVGNRRVRYAEESGFLLDGDGAASEPFADLSRAAAFLLRR